LLEETGRAGARSELHRQALQFYAKLLAEHRDDPEVRPRLDRGYLTLLRRLVCANRPEEADKVLRQALADGAEDYRVWFDVARVRLALNETAGYRAACAHLLERFGHAGHPDDANSIAWVCVLAPDAVTDPQRPLELAERAVALGPSRYPAKSADYLNTLGAALYRAGRYAEAVERLSQAVQARVAGGTGWDWFLLAMAHARAGRPDEARRCYDAGARWLEQNQLRVGRDPRQAECLHRFRAEAAALLPTSR
jgi:tetratricopeptide (TPR) repeat protein